MEEQPGANTVGGFDFLFFRIHPAITFVILAILIPLLTLFMLPAVGTRATSKNLQCMNNLKQLVLALHEYHDVYDSFPPVATYDPDGKPLHSWRVLLLPFVDQPQLYSEIRLNEPWDSEHNQAVARYTLPFFTCPESPQSGTQFASYLAVVGEQTAWPPATSRSLDEVTDDMGTTILLVEVADSTIHWMEPRDLTLEEMDLQIGGDANNSVSSLHEGSAHVAFVDGRIGYLPDATPPDVVRSLLSVDGNERLDESKFHRDPASWW